MTTIDARLARAKAEALLDQTVRTDISDVVIDDKATRETPTCWIFFYNTRTYLEAGSTRQALAGNAPILVLKDDPSAFFGRTDVPIEEQVS